MNFQLIEGKTCKNKKIKLSLSHYPDEPHRKMYFIATTQKLIQEFLYVL